jgi:hypothetical protein
MRGFMSLHNKRKVEKDKSKLIRYYYTFLDLPQCGGL